MQLNDFRTDSLNFTQSHTIFLINPSLIEFNKSELAYFE